MTTHIAFIGGGNMALAMASGLVRSGHPASHISMADPATAQHEQFAALGKVNTHTDNAAAIAAADIVVLAVKPHLIGPVCRALAATISAHQPLVVSVAAGITINAIGADLDGHERIVRVMPNTPALVGQGVSGLYADTAVNAADRALVGDLMASVGRVAWVDTEDALHDITAISGSGPAYFFLFMEYLEREARRLGFSDEQAAHLVRDTAAGAAAMALDSDVELDELRRRVTSPGGTTAAAIGAFEHGDLAALITSAVDAARTRSVELAQPAGDD